MNKPQTAQEAMDICKEYQCIITFRNGNDSPQPDWVEVSLNAWTKVYGRDIIEAVSRLSGMYHTVPYLYEKLEWWNEQLRWNDWDYWRGLNKEVSQ